MKRYLTVALMLIVVSSALATVVVARSRPQGPYGSIDLTAEARPAGWLDDLFSWLSPPPPPPSPAPTDDPPGYESAEPGDRTPAGSPDFLRGLQGSWDGSEGLIASFCMFSHSAPDDPIVYPGQAGASHLHDFFGNKATNASSTDDSLRASAATTCNFAGDSAAYWVPALYENGQRIVPTHMSAYYSAGYKSRDSIEPFPRGLKLLVKDQGAWAWYCYNGRPDSTLYNEPPTCPSGQHLALKIVFPDCWDGKYLDVPDHRSHMAYAYAGRCPSSHPVPVPQLRYFVDYVGAEGGTVVLAPLDNPSSPHADFVNSWEQGQFSRAVRDCIVADVRCDGTM